MIANCSEVGTDGHADAVESVTSRADAREGFFAALYSKSDLANCRTAGSESMKRRGLYGSSCQVCTSPFFTASSRRRTRSEPPLRRVLVASARTVALMPFHFASNNPPTLEPLTELSAFTAAI